MSKPEQKVKARVEQIALMPTERALGFDRIVVGTYDEANAQLREWAALVEAKTTEPIDYTVRWSDSREAEGRYDLRPEDVELADLGRRLLAVAACYGGILQPANMTDQEYRQLLERSEWHDACRDFTFAGYQVELVPRVAVHNPPLVRSIEFERHVAQLDPATVIIHGVSPEVSRVANAQPMPLRQFWLTGVSHPDPLKQMVRLADRLIAFQSGTEPVGAFERLEALARWYAKPVDRVVSERALELRTDMHPSVGVLYRDGQDQDGRSLLPRIWEYARRLDAGTIVLHPGRGPAGRMIENVAEAQGLFDTPVVDPGLIARRSSRLVIFRDGTEPEHFFDAAIATAEERGIPIAMVNAKPLARPLELPVPPTNVVRPNLRRAVTGGHRR